MADLSLNSLSVDAIQADLRGSEEERLKKQALNNVVRQREAAAIRGDQGKKPASASGSSSKPAPAPKAEKPDPQKEIKELAEISQKVETFMNHPRFGPKLRGIAIPRNGTLAEYKVCLEQIRNKLGEGLAGASVRKVYVSVLGVCLPLLETDSAPASLRLPPNSAKFISDAVDNGAFQDEFEELAIEYSKFFRSGPIPRLLMGTFYSLLEFKKMYEVGMIDPLTGQLRPEILAAIQAAQQPQQPQAQAASSSYVPPPQPQPEPQQAQEFVLPPPMKIYPDPVPMPEPTAPEYGLPTISSRDHPLAAASTSDSGMGVFAPDEVEVKYEIKPVPPPKKSSRGKGRQL